MPAHKKYRTQEDLRQSATLRMAKWRADNPDRSKANNRRTVARWRRDNPEKNREMKIRSYDKNPVTRMLKSAEQRAAKSGLPFEITADDIVIPTHCPALGFELINGGGRDTSPSLDRIRSELGYVRGNIHVISTRANRIKNDSTPEELRLLADYVAKVAA